MSFLMHGLRESLSSESHMCFLWIFFPMDIISVDGTSCWIQIFTCHSAFSMLTLVCTVTGFSNV